MTDAIPIPADDYVPVGPERAVSVAHAAQEVLSDIAHAKRHAAAVSGGNPERVAFNLLHVANHTTGAIKQQNSSISNLVQLDPRAGAELARLRDTTRSLDSLCPVPGCEIRGGDGWQYAPPGPARGKTPAHLAQTVLVALTHSRQHVQAAQDAKDAENLAFDLQHLASHVDEAHSHQVKYIGAIREIFNAVDAELGALGELADVGATGKAPERSMAGQLTLAQERCGSCGELTGGGICIECGDGDSYRELRARFAGKSVNGALS